MKKGILAILLLCLALVLAGCACKHAETELTGAVDATCAQEGYTGDTVCLKCNETVQKGEAIPMLEHTPGETVDVREATCTENGYTGDIYCSACGALLTAGEEIPALDHLPGERYHVVEPTCTEMGYTGEVDCERCYQTLEEDEEIPALGHTLGEAYGVVEATCLQEGYTGDCDCSVCGETVEGEIIPKLAHSYADGVCTVCGWREAGLYAGDELLMTWDALLENGYVVADGEGGRRLKYVADSLYGTLVVAEGVEQVGDSDPLCSGGESKLECVYLPSTVTTIRSDAFNGCAALKEVRFFGPVESIGGGAFRDCTALEVFEIPEGLENIPDYMLCGCTSLKSIVIPSWVKVVGMCAFDGCSALEKVELSEGIEEIEGFAFGGTAIHELVYPSTVTAVGDMCGPYSETLPNLTYVDLSKISLPVFKASFAGCPNLKTIIFPEDMEETWSYILGNCYAVEELVLPEGLKELDDLFYTHEEEKSHLKRVVWPVSLLDGSAFRVCNELEEILYRGSELQWNLTLSKDLFEGVNVVYDYQD